MFGKQLAKKKLRSLLGLFEPALKRLFYLVVIQFNIE
jgi:hypothetical protein